MTDLGRPGSGASDGIGAARAAEASDAAHAAEASDAAHAAEGSREPEAATTTRARRGKPRSRGASALREAVLVLGTALVLSLLIKTFLVQAFFIPSGSMETTLDVGDRVLVSRLAPGVLDLHRGDIVVFVDPNDWLNEQAQPDNPARDALVKVGEWVGLLPSNTGSHLIKRLIGLPGDHVTCCDDSGRITVNGTAIDEPYVIAGAVPSTIPFDVVVPEDSLFVLGDNRPQSGDSRLHLADPGGPFVPMDNVVGVAQLRVWPFDRFGVLHNPGETFAAVPDAVAGSDPGSGSGSGSG